jgi:hypothetical protein
MLSRVSRKTRAGTAIAAGALLAGGFVALTAAPAVAAATGGVGASLPYVELQAENAATNGTDHRPERGLQHAAGRGVLPQGGDPAGHRQVRRVHHAAPTNSIVFRYSIPDTGGGSVYTAPLSLYINGTRSTDFTLTNAYSWYYGGYPFTNSPGSNPHHFYDEVNRLFTLSYPAGTTFRLQVDTAGASSYTIDFADFENVAGRCRSRRLGLDRELRRGPDGCQQLHVRHDPGHRRRRGRWHRLDPAGHIQDSRTHSSSTTSPSRAPGCGNRGPPVTGSASTATTPPNPSTNVHLADFAIFGNVLSANGRRSGQRHRRRR